MLQEYNLKCEILHLAETHSEDTDSFRNLFMGLQFTFYFVVIVSNEYLVGESLQLCHGVGDLFVKCIPQWQYQTRHN